MSRPIMALALALLWLVSITAQGQTPSCPTITMTGPTGFKAPDGTATLRLSISASEIQIQSLQYRWTSRSGEIVSGQGTSSVQIRPADRNGFSAMVEVTGLPTGCPSPFTEVVTVDSLAPIAGKSGQDAASACPTISVSGPATLDVTAPEQFSVNVSGPVVGELKFVWQVSIGEIVEGQGTTQIKVKTSPWIGLTIISLQPSPCLGFPRVAEAPPPSQPLLSVQFSLWWTSS